MGSFGFIQPQQVNVPTPPRNGGVQWDPSLANSGASQLGQAAGQLLQGAANMKQAEQAHYQQKYDSAVQGIASGTLINPDYTEIMKWGQRAGLPMKANVTPQDVAAHAQTQAQAAYAQQAQDTNDSAVASGLPGNPMGQVAVAAQRSLPPAPTAPPPAPPGFMGRMMQGAKQMFGGGYPQVSNDSDMGQFLQNLSKASAGGGLLPSLANANEEADLQHHLNMATKKLGLQDTENGQQLTGQIFQKMLQGDPNATEILFKTGHIKDMPIDSLEAGIARAEPNLSTGQVRQKAGQIMLYMDTGGPAMQGKLMDMQKELLPHFDNNPAKVQAFFQDPTNPNNQPHMSVDEEKQYTDSMKTILDARVGVPVSLVAQYASAQLAGKDDVAKAILKSIDSNYPAQNAVDATNKKIDLNQGQQRINNDWANIQGTLALRGMEAETGRFSELRKGLEDTGALPADMIEHPGNYSKEQYLAAAQLVASKNNDVAALLKKYGGSAPTQQVTGGERTLTSPFNPKPVLGGTPPPDNWMAGILGSKPITPGFSNDQRVQSLKQQLLRVPKADRARVLSTTAMPEDVRKQLMDWDPDKEQVDQNAPAINNWLQDIGR